MIREINGDVGAQGETYDDTEIRGIVAGKVDKINGKGLSSNDFTDELKEKLDEMGEGSFVPQGGTIGQVLAKASNVDGDVEWVEPSVGGATSGDTLPIGAVLEWYSDVIPENWLLCNGQEVSRTDYAELFNTLGIKYGSGNGNTTFNLPNLKGRVAIGKDENDEDFNEIGKTGGEKKHKLTIEEMPGHTHNYNRHHFWTGEQTDIPDILGDTSVVRGSGIQIPTSWAGGNQLHNNLQPYITCNFIIKAKQSAGLVATVVDSLESTSETDALSAKQGKVLNQKLGLKSLYENLEGNQGQVQLNNSAENFDYFYITFIVLANEEQQEKTIRVEKPNGKMFYESMQYSLANDHVEVFSRFAINNNIINPLTGNCGYRTQSYLNGSVAMNLDSTNYMRITKVYGGKY